MIQLEKEISPEEKFMIKPYYIIWIVILSLER